MRDHNNAPVALFIDPAPLASAPCHNREGCIPVSLFDDSTWYARPCLLRVCHNISNRCADRHVVEVSVAVTAGGGAVVSFDFDEGSYGGFGLVSDYSLPSPVYFGFSGRTGGATNNQYDHSLPNHHSQQR